jgi:hypothetical protein
MSMILDGSNGVTFNDASLQGAAASPYVLKNRIINGDMAISQRNGTSSVNVSGTTYAYQMDRFYCGGLSGIATPFTLQQVTDAPTGFTNSVKITVANTDALANAATEYGFQQSIEANNTTDFNLGTANAVTVTLSFWVKSSLTGTFGIGIRNAPTFNRAYVATYTISAANTWERKTVTLTMDTTGTWNNSGTSASMNVTWSLGCGSNFNGTAGTWAAGGAVQTSGSVRLVSNAAATWQITGVQLEQNTSATPFERRLYNQELANCQRYYWRSVALNSLDQGITSGIVETATSASCVFSYPVTMRASPSFSSSGINFYSPASGGITFTLTQTRCSSTSGGVLVGITGGTAGQSGGLYAPSSSSAYIQLSSEL